MISRSTKANGKIINPEGIINVLKIGMLTNLVPIISAENIRVINIDDSNIKKRFKLHLMPSSNNFSFILLPCDEDNAPI